MVTLTSFDVGKQFGLSISTLLILLIIVFVKPRLKADEELRLQTCSCVGPNDEQTTTYLCGVSH